MYDVNKIKEIVKDNLSNYRYEHCLLTAEEAKKLAKVYGVDGEKAYLAGILHDFAKEFNRNENMKWIKKGNLSKDILCDEYVKIAHSYIGAIAIKELFEVDDQICNAVKYHTIGNVKMCLFDKIVFISDKIGRNDKSKFIENLKKKAYKNIDEALIFYFKNQKEKFKKNGKKLHPDTIELLNKISK